MNAHLRIPGVGRAGHRALLVIFALSLVLPLSGISLTRALTPRGPPLHVYHDTRPATRGRFDGTHWVAGDPTGVFAPGDAVVWETWTDVADGVVISAGFDLFCGGRPFGGADFRTTPDRPRPRGYLAVGMTLPADLPDGACQIAREADYHGEDGRTEHETFRPISFTVRRAAP